MPGRSKYSILGRVNWEDLYNGFLALDEKKQVLFLGGGILLILLMLILPITCASSKLSGLEKEYEANREGNETFAGKIAEYQKQKSQLQDYKQKASKAQGGSISTVIEQLAGEAGIKENIERIKPITLAATDFYDEEGVDAVISKISLDQIVNFLYRLENYGDFPLKVKKFQLKPRYGNRDQFTATFQATTIKLKGDENE
ncbi:MAG: hypothetical protein Q7T11_05205 [Deltaproteobacteria bacterium]|nr:hypothetical protein [Deltaproteobacteria bacterium]